MLKFQHGVLDMKKYFEVLRKCPLFNGIEDSDLLGLLGCLDAKIMSFEKKYTIFTEGSKAKYLGIVLSGSAQIVQMDYYGNRSILGNVGPSEMFAEAFACAETKTIPVSVIATELSDIMLIDCAHILHTCKNGCGFHHQLIFNLMKDLATKSIMFHQRIDITSKRTTREKLLAYLFAEAKRAGKNSCYIPFDRQELADYLEVERSGLSAEISKLRAEGILESQKNHFRLL